MGETSKHKLRVTIWPCKFNHRNVKKHSELLSCTQKWPSAWPGRWRKFSRGACPNLNLESRKRREGFSWGKNVSNKVKGWRVWSMYTELWIFPPYSLPRFLVIRMSWESAFYFSFLQHPNNWRHAEPCQNSCILLGCIVYALSTNAAGKKISTILCLSLKNSGWIGLPKGLMYLKDRTWIDWSFAFCGRCYRQRLSLVLSQLD